MPVMPAITADVTDSTATSNTDITGLNFPVASGRMYWFRAQIPFTSAAVTTGGEFGVNASATPTFLTFTTTYPSTATAMEYGNTATNDGSAPAANTATTTGNMATVEGFVRASASGAVQFRMDTEVGSSAITVKAGAFVQYRDLNA